MINQRNGWCKAARSWRVRQATDRSNERSSSNASSQRKPRSKSSAKQERSIESEARAKPYLDLIFKDIPGTEPKYRVECHGRVCKIDARMDNAWIGPLQTTYPERTMFGTMSFSDKTFVELLTEGAALATRIHYEASEAIHACAIANPEPGDVSYQLTMDNAHRVTAQINGSLANQPAGRCIATALQGAITKTPVAPNTQIEDRERGLTLPLEE